MADNNPVQPVLDIRGLSVTLPKGADRKFAIEDISLSVGRGEIVCVVGESGSGKSVSAQTVMGLIPRKDLTPVAGEIMLQGEDLLKKTEIELRNLRGVKMAMIFQEPMTALNPVMQVGDQIGEMLEIHTSMSASERRERIIEVMNDVGLPDVDKMIDSYPHQLSGGQRQRIMIAMALALEPALLIADEPTTALDVTTQAQILDLIKDIQKRHGTGVLFITHDFGVVAEIADRVVVMQDGKVVEQGTSDPGADETARALHQNADCVRPQPDAAKTRSRLPVASRYWRPGALKRCTASLAGSAAAAWFTPQSMWNWKSGAERPSGWSVNPAPANPRWRAVSCAWLTRPAVR